MIKNPARFNESFLKVVIVLAGMLLAGLAGWHVAGAGLSIQEVIGALILLAALTVLALGERGIRVGFLMWVVMFAVGYRTIHVTEVYLLHPLILLILALLALLIIQNSFFDHRPISWVVPRLLLVFSLFWVWGWVVATLEGRTLDAMLVELDNFLVLVPLFVVMGYVLDRPQAWRQAVLAFFGAGTFIALSGFGEYLLPGSEKLFLPATGLAQFTDVASFARAAFSLWGSTDGVFICALTLPLILPLWRWHTGMGPRACLAAAAALQVIAIYIGGFRSLWALAGVVVLLLLMLYQGSRGALVGGLGLLGVYVLLPEAAKLHFGSLLAAVQGNFQDSSSQGRWERATTALDTVMTQPWGVGWAGSGWVHSDFIQVGANLSLLGGLIFLIWYILTLVSLLRLHLRRRNDPLVLGLIGSFLVAGGLLLFEGVTVLPQEAMPVFFVWGLVELKLRRAPAEAEEPAG